MDLTLDLMYEIVKNLVNLGAILLIAIIMFRYLIESKREQERKMMELLNGKLEKMITLQEKILDKLECMNTELKVLNVRISEMEEKRRGDK